MKRLNNKTVVEKKRVFEVFFKRRINNKDLSKKEQAINAM